MLCLRHVATGRWVHFAMVAGRGFTRQHRAGPLHSNRRAAAKPPQKRCTATEERLRLMLDVTKKLRVDCL